MLKQLERREPGGRPECQLPHRTPRLECSRRLSARALNTSPVPRTCSVLWHKRTCERNGLPKPPLCRTTESIVYLIRLHTENFHKYLYFRKKLTFIRTRYRQNQCLWCHYGDKESLENQGVFHLFLKIKYSRLSKI